MSVTVISELGLIQKLGLYKTLFSLSQDLNRTDEVFNLSNKVPHKVLKKTLQPIVNRLKQDPLAARKFKSMQRLAPIDLNKLGDLPQGSLGHEYARFMFERGLDPKFHPELELFDEIQYLRLHVYETHDLWHVVTGFDTNPAGEMGLQGFYFQQMRGPLSLAILTAGLMNSLVKDPEDAPRRLDAIAKGWEMGKTTKLLFAIDWDAHWETPLAELRNQIGIQPSMRTIH